MTIGNRAVCEIKIRARKNGISKTREAKKLGINPHSLKEWGKNMNPSAYYLQQMHYAGYDVIYILTGERKHEETEL